MEKAGCNFFILVHPRDGLKPNLDRLKQNIPKNQTFNDEKSVYTILLQYQHRMEGTIFLKKTLFWIMER